jgi:hopanoid-associated phosphorylase
MTMIGIVTGFRAEARCLRHDRNRIICSGGDAERARAGAERLVKMGVEALVSFGLAGGLDPAMVSGRLLLPEAVLLPDGRAIRTHEGWRQRLAHLARAENLDPMTAPVAGSDRLLATAPDKRALFEATRALAVDMESHAVAVVAEQAGLPYVVVRAVADTSDEAIPSAAQKGLGPGGEIRHLAVLKQILLHPGEARSVLRLGRESGRALTALRRVAALAPDLAFV